MDDRKCKKKRDGNVFYRFPTGDTFLDTRDILRRRIDGVDIKGYVDMYSDNDIDGSYTGRPSDPSDVPTQDADDL